jgi:teichuronic acid biosynthesis glycosyltransferase TuaC
VRILFLSLTYPSPWRPTAGTYNRSLVRALRVNHEVRVVAPVPWTLALRGRVARGEARPPDEPATLHPLYIYPPKMLRARYGAFLWHSVKGTVRDLAKSFPPEVVLSYWLHPDGAAGLRAAKELGAGSAVMVAGSDALLLTQDPQRRRAILDVLNCSDAVLTIGEALASRIVALGARAEHVHAVQRGIDQSLFFPGSRSEARETLGLPRERFLLLWAGRMVPVKGLDVLLESCRRVADQGAPFSLLLVGAGEEEAFLRKLARRLGLEHHVNFVGPIPQEALPAWYRAADLTVLPSRSEGVPNVLRESLACGTPILASDVGGVRSVTPDPDQDLVPPEDPEALAQAILRRVRKLVPGASPRSPSSTWEDAAESVASVLATCAMSGVGRRT